jgi:hypothetical protein
MLFVVAVNPPSRMVFVVGLAALGAVAGCGGHPLKGGGHDGGAAGQGAAGQGGDGGTGSTTCQGLDEATCKATTGCIAEICPTCYGQTTFTTCYRSDDPPPVCSIARPCGPGPCAGLDENTCKGTGGCVTQYCQVCTHVPTFAACTPPGASVACPGEACVTATPCISLDETTCKMRSNCQPNYCCGGNVYGGCGLTGVAFNCMTSCPTTTPCAGYDETTCKERSYCTPVYCPNCAGGESYAGCSSPGQPVACSAACPAPLPCSALDETTCKTRSDCHPGYCGNCSGVQEFTACLGPNEAVACPGYNCPLMPVPCASVTDEATCDARTDCHSVFVDPGTCGCNAVGCCASFVYCADGQAACQGDPACLLPAPHCEAPAYVVSYTAGCFEGCVRPTECAP